MPAENEISKIEWVEIWSQLSDCLTKSGASTAWRSPKMGWSVTVFIYVSLQVWRSFVYVNIKYQL